MRHRYMLNIGLEESSILGNGGRIPAPRALKAVRKSSRALHFTARIRHAVRDSDSEPTLIIEFRTETPDFDRVQRLADTLCLQLKQEAIAAAELDTSGHVEHGVLRGPMSERWGTFSPEYFVMLNGSRAA